MSAAVPWRRLERRARWAFATGLAILCLGITTPAIAPADDDADARPIKKIAAVVTVYHHNSHADVIVSRLLQTDTLDGRGRKPRLELVSLYVDQQHKNDVSRRLADEHGFTIYDNIADALTLGTGQLAVDGVLVVAEHGDYPRSPLGQTEFPKRRFMEQVLKVFDSSGRAVPIFNDKHISDNWTDIDWIYQGCRQRNVPLMAGSSLPGAWREPAIDVPRDARLKSVLMLSYHTLDAYGFHGLEALQSLVERRAGGETGVASVQCLTGEAVWEAGRQGAYDPEMLEAALARQRNRVRRPIEQFVKEPILFVIDYADGLRACMLTLNGVVADWSAAWREDDGRLQSLVFATQENRPFQHFGLLVRGIEEMMQTGRPTWPAERTYLSSGILDACLQSQQQQGQRLATPHLAIRYASEWNWSPPPPMPPDRPLQGQ